MIRAIYHSSNFSISFYPGYIQFNMARNVMLSSARPIIDIDTATPHMRLAVQFLGRLSNKTSKLQVTRQQHL